MKKILVAFNATTYSNSLSRFAIQIAKQSQSHLQGIFINPSLVPVAQYPFPNDLPLASTGLVSTEEFVRENQNLMYEHIQLFKEDCTAAGIDFMTDHDKDITLEELIDHSAFSDLILCDTKDQLGNISVQELLANTHCPVLITPQNSDALPIRSVLCYDESFSSILAIKMYSYLFPEWKDLPTHILSINPKGDNGTKYDNYLNDFLPPHFPNIEKQMLEGNLQKELIGFIRSQNEIPTIVVMGAYGRNAISRVFHKSLANIVMDETNAFVFIMHE